MGATRAAGARGQLVSPRRDGRVGARWALPILVCLALLSSSCGPKRVRLDGGPPRPPNEVALLQNQWEFYGPQVTITRVDNQDVRRLFGVTYEIELPPGLHTVEFGYSSAHQGESVDNAIPILDAKPGRRYEARAEFLGADSTWAVVFGGRGRWRETIIDVGTGDIAAPAPTATPAVVLPDEMLRD